MIKKHGGQAVELLHYETAEILCTYPSIQAAGKAVNQKVNTVTTWMNQYDRWIERGSIVEKKPPQQGNEQVVGLWRRL